QSIAQQRGVGSGYAFRDHNYCEIRYKFVPEEDSNWGCLDTGSGMSLIDEDLLTTLLWKKRTRLRHSIKVKGVSGVADAWEAVTLTIYFPDATQKKMAQITREFHLVQNLDCGIIFGNDIIAPEKIVIDVAKKSAVIQSCNNLPCQLRVTPRRKVTNHTVRCSKATVVPPRSSCPLPIRFAGLKNKQDYLLLPVGNN